MSILTDPIDPTRRVHLDADEVEGLAALLLPEPTGTIAFTGQQAAYLLRLLKAAARRNIHPDLARVHEDCRRLVTAAELQAATVT